MNIKDILKAVFALAIIVAIGVGLGWLASRHSATQTSPVPSPETFSPPAVVTTPAQPASVVATKANPTAATPADASTETNWDDQISDILVDDTEITNKVAELLKLYPTMPPEGKLEAVEHLENLVDDAAYAPLAKIAADPNTPPKVSQSLIDDLFNRPNSVRMPLALEIARNPQHPNAKGGKEILESFLDEDHGDDWAAWEKEMNGWLKENPD